MNPAEDDEDSYSEGGGNDDDSGDGGGLDDVGGGGGSGRDLSEMRSGFSGAGSESVRVFKAKH